MTDKRPHFIPGTGWRYDSEHSMRHRLEGHDYKGRSIYQITITLDDRSKPRLGSLRWTEEGKAVVDLTPLGERVRSCWLQISQRHPGVSSIVLQIMPEHLHGVLFVTLAQKVHLGKIIAGFKTGCSHAWWEIEPEVCGASPSCAPSLPRSKGAKGPSLFSPGYQDSVLIGKGQLKNMINYVLDNPRRALIKRDNPDLFRVVSNLNIGGRTFAAIGNQWLLDKPMRMQVRCHNNTSEQNLRLIALQKAYFLEMGKMGAVVVSPCISPGEKEIARAVLAARQPLIVILENGFPPLYKPPGLYFEACAEGLLLMLAPWPYHADRRTITRQQCLALNEMAGSICTDLWTPEMEWQLLNEPPMAE